MNGILLVDKPNGPTSHDVVDAVRRMTGQRRCGHTGTLDPFATGLLPLCLGPATRLARFVSGAAKTYRAVVRFGFATDTYDATGRSLGPPVEVRLERDGLESLLASFVGRQQQVPPPFAAKRIGGQRMYALARAGKPVRPGPVIVVIRRIVLEQIEGERATMEIEVESGTYVRSLAHDLGKRLGCGAHLEELRRTRIGPFSVASALSLEELEEMARSGGIGAAVLGPEEALAELPALRLGRWGAARIKHGGVVGQEDIAGAAPSLVPGQACRLIGPGGELIGVGEAGKLPAQFRPVVVLARPEPTA